MYTYEANRGVLSPRGRRAAMRRGRLNAVVVAEAKFIGRYHEPSFNRRRLPVYGRSIDPLCDKAPVTRQSSVKYGIDRGYTETTVSARRSGRTSPLPRDFAVNSN